MKATECQLFKLETNLNYCHFKISRIKIQFLIVFYKKKVHFDNHLYIQTSHFEMIDLTIKFKNVFSLNLSRHNFLSNCDFFI